MHGLPAPLAAVSSSDEPALHDLLSLWRDLTRAALDQQALGQTASALLQYRRALTAAEALLDKPTWPDRTDDVLAALVVSHHNLSDLLEELGRTAESVTHLCAPHLRLLALDQDGIAPEVRAAAWRHLGETRRHLILRRLRRDGSAEAIAAIDDTLAALPPNIVAH